MGGGETVAGPGGPVTIMVITGDLREATRGSVTRQGAPLLLAGPARTGSIATSEDGPPAGHPAGTVS
jgi:hypothetical protein